MGLAQDVGIIVFSRMKSSRFPGKALKMLGGYPLVERVIRRAQLTGYPVVLATSDTVEDDKLEELAQKIGVKCYRGSENNVLQRAVLAAEYFGFKAFARLCGDRPLFSIKEMLFALDLWQNKEDKPDLITNHYPEKSLRGMTTEVVNTLSLRSILDHNPDQDEREHLTLGFYRRIDQLDFISLLPRYQKWNNHSGFAVDTEDDYNLLKQFITENSRLDFELEAELLSYNS